MKPMRRFLALLFPPEAVFIAGLYALLLSIFAGLRLLLLWRNANHAAETPVLTLLQSFWVGARFDLAVASYLLIPLFLLLLVVRNWQRGLILAAFTALFGVLMLLGIAEAEFYRDLEMRFNNLVFEYLGHASIVGGMIWDGYPVARYLLLWAVLCLFLAGGVYRLYRSLLLPARSETTGWRFVPYTAGTAVMLALMVFASRGGFAHEPLRWGDAVFSQDPFANDLALNGLFTLGRSGLEKFAGDGSFWLKAHSPAAARSATRAMLLLGDEADLSSDQFPLLREEREDDPVPFLRPSSPEQPVNVVVILMESFSARHVGALGAEPSLTPAFDALCREGILFERTFSNGTHTHQGVFASLASFPNLPGYEYLMKTLESNQEFSGLPTLLSRQGYRSVFLYNGLFSWDNKEGFFRKHGIDRFIGTGEFVNPTFVDPVWGVSDHDVFVRANEEFRSMAERGPFFGAILTLSNHSPFNLPEPLPFPRIRTGDGFEGRYNAMRYADWALGEFFRQARQEPYFRNTLFVLTGDHGFGTPPAITGMRLERFHVPLLFYAPHLLTEQGGRRQTVASQVDIGATVLGLLDLDVPHQIWGRDLFSPTLQDGGFAVIKPSGGEEMAALIEGDFVLIQAPREKPQLYRYSLGFPPAAGTDIYAAEEERGKAMRQRLLGYIQSGLMGLRERRLGIPAPPAPAADVRAALPTKFRRN